MENKKCSKPPTSMYIRIYIYNIVVISTKVNIIIYFHILVIMVVINLEYNGYYLQYHYNHPSIMWVKQCHISPMTGNGKHTIFKNGDLGVGLLLLLKHYIYIYREIERDDINYSNYIIAIVVQQNHIDYYKYIYIWRLYTSKDNNDVSVIFMGKS